MSNIEHVAIEIERGSSGSCEPKTPTVEKLRKRSNLTTNNQTDGQSEIEMQAISHANDAISSDETVPKEQQKEVQNETIRKFNRYEFRRLLYDIWMSTVYMIMLVAVCVFVGFVADAIVKSLHTGNIDQYTF